VSDRSDTARRPRFELHLGDCVEWIKTLADRSVALCVMDPAYESLEKHRAKGTTTRLKVSDASSNEWFPIFRNERFPEMMRELHRVLAKDAHLYVMADEETTFEHTKPTGQAAGFKWWKALDWVKTGAHADEDDPMRILHPSELELDDVAIGMGYHWRNSKEHIGFLEKGKRRLLHLGWPDVLPVPRVRNGYPTEKPVALLSKLIENSSLPGELVIDLFNGSGSTGEAALRLGRDYAGADVKDTAIASARVRLAQFGDEMKVTTARVAPSQGGLFG
jgi:site-specific DNA-methyltransferase (adenine-specific)